MLSHLFSTHCLLSTHYYYLLSITKHCYCLRLAIIYLLPLPCKDSYTLYSVLGTPALPSSFLYCLHLHCLTHNQLLVVYAVPIIDISFSLFPLKSHTQCAHYLSRSLRSLSCYPPLARFYNLTMLTNMFIFYSSALFNIYSQLTLHIFAVILFLAPLRYKNG